MSSNSEQFLPAMCEIAREDGGFLMTYFQRHIKIEYKGDADLVTAADRASEKLIRARIGARWPSHDILGEEQGLNDQGSEYRWFVDPLDGTTNFAHGFPVFAVSIALLDDGEPLVGAVFNPISNELFTAVRNQGAQLNQKPIHVSDIATLSKSLLSTGFPTHKRQSNPNIHYYWEFTLRSHGVRGAGSAALDLCCVAAGRFDGFWEFGLKSWDTAAGILIVREAGGTVTDFEGRPAHPGDRELFASNGPIHHELLTIAAEIAARPATLPQ